MSADTAEPHFPALIPVPPGFPVTWASPDDERLFWAQDRMHSPDPMVPLEVDFWLKVYDGFSLAAKVYEMPVKAHARCFNTYLYMAIAPAVPPEQMEAQGKRMEERMREAMGQLEASWKEAWLPEIQSHLAWWAAFDLRGASLSSLVTHLQETLPRTDRLWELHFRIVFPAYVAISQFDELYRDLFGGEGAFNAYRLLQGFDNKTLETGRELWALSRKARAVPEARRLLEERDSSEIMEELGKTAAGRAFLNELHGYLATYGQRGDKWGLSDPSWIENPAPVIKNLKDYASQPDRDLEADHASLVVERERAVAEARERLKGYPQPVREQFESLLKVAQCGNVLTEDHGFWIDFNSTYRVRCVFLEFGRRFAEAGVVDKADDVFYLTLKDLLGAEATVRGASLRARVAERRQEVERFRKISPPPVLGTDYGPPPDNPVGRFIAKFFGGPPPASEVPGVVAGHAGSPGKVRGRARVIRSLNEADKLKRGDILVAETTAPPWTPLFATAGGIVTDTGGILSHCAVVAREYRIPAVVGTGRATAMILDGQLLEVDGDAGTVRVVGD